MPEKSKHGTRKKRPSVERATSVSGLILSLVCCAGLLHVELKIHRHEQLLSAARIDSVAPDQKPQRNTEQAPVQETTRQEMDTKPSHAKDAAGSSLEGRPSSLS